MVALEKMGDASGFSKGALIAALARSKVEKKSDMVATD
jgi:hypothetical protein